MEKKPSLLKGTIWNTLGSTMYGANSFIMLALVSRVGTVDQAGYFGIAFTTAQILYIVGLFGVNTYQMTDYQEKYCFSDYAKGRIFSCALMLVGGLLSIFLLDFTGKKSVYLCILTVLMLLNAVGELYQSLFFQKNRLDLSGSALFYRTFWSLFAFVVVLLTTGNILLSIIVQTAVNLVVTLYYALRVAPKFISKTAAPLRHGAAALMMECLPLFLSMFLMNILINASKYGIEFLMDDTAQGYYNMLFMPAQVINLCSQFVFKPLLNRYASLFAEKQDKEAIFLLIKQIALVLGFTLICCVAAFILGPEVLGLLYSKDLSAFRLALVLVVLGGGVFACCQLFYYIFVILRRQKWVLGIYLGASAVAFIFTAALVGTLGIVGAALSFILIHLVILAAYAFLLRLFLRGRHHA